MQKKDNGASSSLAQTPLNISTKRENELEYIKGLPRHQGKREYIAILRGEHVSYRKRCLAHCFYCQNFYLDGVEPCLVHLCPLHGIYPYPKKEIVEDTQIKDDESYPKGAA